MDDSQQGFIKCPDCDFISLSQGGLGVHRSKRHKIIIPDDVKSLYVERIFPEGKPVYCCLCDVTIGSIANFRRHMKNNHESIKLFESAKCCICGKKFPKGRGAGVHLQRHHNIGSNNSYPHSPTPVMPFTNRDNTNTPWSRSRLRRRSNPVSPMSCQDPNHVYDSTVDSSTNSNEVISDTVHAQCQSSPISPYQSLNPIPNLPCSTTKDPINNNPHPTLMVLHPDEDSLDPTHSPPRPTIANPHHTTSLQQSPEPPVALSGCTDAISDIPSLSPIPSHEKIPSQLPQHPPVISITPTPHQTYPDPSVAFRVVLIVMVIVVIISPNNPYYTPSSANSASQNPFIIPPPLSESFLTSSSDMSCSNSNTSSSHADPDPSVAFSGGTDRDAPSFTTPQHKKSYPVELVNLDPEDDDDDDDDLEHSRPSSAISPSTSYPDNTNNTVQFNDYSSIDTDPPLPSDIPVNPSSNNTNHSEFANCWTSRIKSTDSFEAFSFQCEKFAEVVVKEAKVKTSNASRPRQRSNRPNNRDVNSNRPRVLPNPIAARRIQTLYRLSKKTAAKQILNDNNTVYSGTNDQAKDYFTNTFSANPINIDEVLESLNRHVPTANEDPTVIEPMSEKVIKNKLKSMSNSAPGKDCVEYRHLRQVDSECKVLTCIFNKCLKQKQIPSIWKESTTILIYKKANSDDASNFRPIALMSCLYKLFTAILASRATNFAINNNLMSHQQKSARPAEGCHEHTFTLQSIIADCKRNTKDCYIAWLDLRNAFGSINHEAIFIKYSPTPLARRIFVATLQVSHMDTGGKRPLRCGGLTGPMFTLALKGPEAPL
ncbi:uncharacterized protein LOC113214946 [Paramuricea clavata]|uniref:Uncharacterized protein LOC113214946 n=1 Tax=Paramuricea clavata TaxID=317549 RepID=A0A7D9KXP5_PARCT|nr:uncharacterized protein LOC113214946 [Paramuricea clavata]